MDIEHLNKISMNEENFIVCSINSELNINTLRLNKNQLDWYLVSLNKKIIWTNEILSEFKDLLIWEILIEDSNVDWKDPKNLLLAIEKGRFKDLMNNHFICWSKEDYSFYKNTGMFHHFRIEILEYIIEKKWDWGLKDFLKEFSELFIENGPQKEFDCDSNNFVEETRSYGSLATFKRHNRYLREQFDDHLENSNYSDAAVINEINDLMTFEIFNEGNQFYLKYLWEFFSETTRITWSNEIINTFSTSLNWKKLLQNERINWSIETLTPYQRLIDDFEWINDFDEKEKINAWNGLILNKSLRIDLGELALSNYTFEWSYLGSNVGFQFSNDFLNYLFGSFSILVSNSKTSDFNKFDFFENLQKNQSYILTYEVITTYKKFIDWSEILNSNKVRLSVDFISNFIDVIDFELLSSSKKLDWSKEFILFYHEKFNWEYLKLNKSIEWDDELESIYNTKTFRDTFDDC